MRTRQLAIVPMYIFPLVDMSGEPPFDRFTAAVLSVDRGEPGNLSGPADSWTEPRPASIEWTLVDPDNPHLIDPRVDALTASTHAWLQTAIEAKVRVFGQEF